METNPWEKIDIADYEGHMALSSVGQLQALNEIMEAQLSRYEVDSVEILGIAGGNGLEHADGRYKRVVAVDVNGAYLSLVESRYGKSLPALRCLRADLCAEPERLERAELLIANLVVEYIGCGAFQKAVERAAPSFVSCAIQVNAQNDGGAGWVSESPYIHAFDGLDSVHTQISEAELESALSEIGYRKILRKERPLPNGKTLVQLDFERASTGN